MTEIKIVSGLNYGDESKGLVANAVSTPTCLNIMPSNSCQRAHTVVENGIRRVFRHFGSGTLKGAATYFTEKFLVNPAMFRREWLELNKLGIKPKVYARLGSIIVTPIDMFANVNVEQRRGEDSHSSTGCGVWEAICRDRVLKMQGEEHQVFSNVVEYYEGVLRDRYGVLPDDVREFLNGKYLRSNIEDDISWFYRHITLIENEKEEMELLNSYPLLVFENGQGLLLTDDYSLDIEHNTPALVGASNPAQIISRNFDNSDDLNIEAFYVSRTYLTRHGKGNIGITENLECKKEEINSEMVDRTNVPNPHQGTLRYGKFSQSEADEAVKRAIKDSEYFTRNNLKVKTSIVITHTNEYNGAELFAAAEGKVNLYESDNELTFKPKILLS